MSEMKEKEHERGGEKAEFIAGRAENKEEREGGREKKTEETMRKGGNAASFEL